jgi:tetrahydromethanopterin S-methyltransferase subunit C
MRTIEWVLGIMLGLVALYLVLVNPAAVNQILGSLGNLGAQTFGTLQGRNVQSGGVTVGAFQR